MAAAIKLPRAKAIVLDADNTLWGGIIGEDGMTGIALGPDYPGNAYVAFQRRLLDFHQRGFILVLCRKFAAYYVTGFARTLSHWRGLGVKHFFYPSTVALEELPIAMGEYAAAKTAGETLCAFLEKSDPDLTIYRPRLPRAATDQTVSLLPVKNCDPAELMSKELLCFKARCSRGA